MKAYQRDEQKIFLKLTSLCSESKSIIEDIRVWRKEQPCKLNLLEMEFVDSLAGSAPDIILRLKADVEGARVDLEWVLVVLLLLVQ